MTIEQLEVFRDTSGLSRELQLACRQLAKSLSDCFILTFDPTCTYSGVSLKTRTPLQKVHTYTLQRISGAVWVDTLPDLHDTLASMLAAKRLTGAVSGKVNYLQSLQLAQDIVAAETPSSNVTLQLQGNNTVFIHRFPENFRG